MRLNSLVSVPGSRRRAKRVGRGVGSGHGKTSCRGHKGQKARAGSRSKRGFEGGQMPLKRRLPKRGFHHEKRHPIQVVNVGMLNLFEPGSVIDPEELMKAGLVSPSGGRIKLLGKGELTKGFTIRAHSFSGSARAKIEAAGGRAEVL